MQMFDVYPINDITIEKANGCFVWDNTGTRYLDLYGGHAVISIGHSHPYWKEKIKQQLDKISFYSNSVRIPLQQQLADALAKISDKKDYQLFLCNSGAEANENALKVASFFNGRKKIISFSKAFHGRTSLAVAVTDNPAIQAPVNENEHIIFLPFNDESALTEAMQTNGDEVSAVIIESIQGVGGIKVATDSFLQCARKLCDQTGALLIADEVQSGCGRTGKYFASDFANIEADIYTMAKGMGNGFLVAGILIHPRIAARHFMLGTTFGGNHLGCAAALAVAEVMDKASLMQHAGLMGDYLMENLKNIPDLKDVRGKGLMIGFDVPDSLAELRKNLLWKHQIFTGEAKPSVIRLLPPLTITQKEIDIFLDALHQEIKFLKESNIEKVSISG